MVPQQSTADESNHLPDRRCLDRSDLLLPPCDPTRNDLCSMDLGTVERRALPFIFRSVPLRLGGGLNDSIRDRAWIYRLLHQQSEPQQVFTTSMLAAFVVLSRLDSALWIAALMVSILVSPGSDVRRHIIPACAGSLPLLLYFVLNKALFGDVHTSIGFRKAVANFTSSQYRTSAIVP